MLGNGILVYRMHNVQIEVVGRDCTFARDTPKHNSLTFLDASKHLYTRLCRWVRWLVGWLNGNQEVKSR